MRIMRIMRIMGIMVNGANLPIDASHNAAGE